MELTAVQREALNAIYEKSELEVYQRDGARPFSKDEYRRTRKKLENLRDAWAAIDHDTQMYFIVMIVRMWEDDSDEAPLPDLHPIVSDLLRGMLLPSGAPEKLQGFSEATTYLWSVWCEDRPFPVPIDQAMFDFVCPKISDAFGIPESVARRRAESVLRSLDKQNKLAHKKGYGT